MKITKTSLAAKVIKHLCNKKIAWFIFSATVLWEGKLEMQEHPNQLKDNTKRSEGSTKIK